MFHLRNQPAPGATSPNLPGLDNESNGLRSEREEYMCGNNNNNANANRSQTQMAGLMVGRPATRIFYNKNNNYNKLSLAQLGGARIERERAGYCPVSVWQRRLGQAANNAN